MRLPATFAQRMQPTHTFDQVATLPIAFTTALHGLRHVARLQRNEKVLIQSATGGLGLAAIQIARDVGAEIFATVGTEEKLRFLVEGLILPASHVAISPPRTTPPTSGFTKPFPGIDFDVVLSTGSGEALEEALHRLAPQGRLVDIGRVDVQNLGSLHMEAFQKNATFTSFDLNLLMEHSPEICEQWVFL